jgi:hypothetical protein
VISLKVNNFVRKLLIWENVKQLYTLLKNICIIYTLHKEKKKRE